MELPKFVIDKDVYALGLAEAINGLGTMHDVVATAGETEFVIGCLYVEDGGEIDHESIQAYEDIAAVLWTSELLGEVTFRAVMLSDLKQRLEKTQLHFTIPAFSLN